VAVIFSGLTVIVSLAGLWMVDNAAVRSMALGAMMVVAVSVLAASTLLPALIALLGNRAAGQGRGFQRLATIFTRVPRPRPGFWLRWTRRVTRRPLATAIGTAAVLLVLAIPTLSLSIGTGALQQLPAGSETVRGFDAAARVTGPGASSPVYTLVGFPGRVNTATLARLKARIAADPAVARIAAVERSRSGDQALITAVPRVAGESAHAKALVARLRSTLPALAGRTGQVQVQVGGVTAQQKDFGDLVAGSMWKIALFVLGLSYLVLLVLLRSVLLPLKAVVMNLLSVGAAYGALVAVFQWGWLAGLLGVRTQGHLDALTPPLVLAVVFGLSMDYEVFLLTRIRERFRATGDSRLAVAEGLSSSARTITSAALIMTSVFAVFLGTGIPSIQEIGIGNAVAVAIDATLVRLVLVPATMELLGDWNWWLPRPLARLLPRHEPDSSPPNLAGATA
jgi:RND superfamily putative drug exporter